MSSLVNYIQPARFHSFDYAESESLAQVIFSPRGIAMPKGLYFTAVVFLSFCLLSSFSFFQRLISEVTDRISTKLGHIFVDDCNLIKFGPNSPWHLPPRAGAKTVFETDFEL